MLRRIVMACAAIAAVAVVMAPTDADARWRGGWRGGYYRGWGPAVGLGLGLGLGAGYGYGYGYGYPYYGGGYYAYGGCYRTVRVYTPYGPRWRRVWVC